ncbi:hypothetical protein FZEAL_3001 [Fusarium zealandicum]|uniref:Uncharacterized protein n=1 Tax=Fusarium zealandicum TaxID=1053134 RepID=A0A8H4UQD4_9HYPO|nr:hypothetical protein FZEAL_3001 [Fusarium zealandicum]
MTSESTTFETLLASLQGSDTSAEGEAKRDAFARLVSDEFAKRTMAPLPTAMPSSVGVNGTNGMGQTASMALGSAAFPTIAPNGHTTSRPASSASGASAPHAPTAAGSHSGSPALSSPLLPPGQHKSPPMQQATVNQSSHSPQLQHPPNGLPAQQSQGPRQPIQQPPPASGTNTSPGARPQSLESSGPYQKLSELIEHAPASAIRQVIRDKWEKALLGSQYHIAFLLNATMHQASPETLARAVQDFGGKLVQTSKRQLITHLTAPDLDELSDIILARVSTQFLDRALARRLETIPARQLVNALARAERLGYDVQDIVGDHDEHVIPSLHSLTVQPDAAPAQPASSQPPASSAPPPMRMQHYQPHPTQPHPTQPHPTQPKQPQQPKQPPYMAQPAQLLQSSTPPNATPGPPLPSGPPGVEFCGCGWPCSSKEALEHHQKKRACHKVRESDKAGRDICLYCGCTFGSGGGLLYHEKSNVCGQHTRETGEKMRPLIAAVREGGRQPPPVLKPSGPAKGIPGNQTPSHTGWAAVQTPSSTSSRDPYGHLTEATRNRFEEEMRQAEEKYGKLMREATMMAEPERTRQLASLKNSYNTKQSVTRKKYGIRLRERRTKAEIAAEQNRLLGPPSDSATPRESEPHPRKRARTEMEGPSPSPSPSPSMPNGSQGESPRKRVPVSEMGGLSGSSATAELTDPTAFLSPSQPRYLPQKAADATGGAGSPERTRQGTSTSLGETQDDLMQIDDGDSESDTDSDDEDIPATLN